MQPLKLGPKSVESYITEISEVVEALAIAGDKVGDTDLVLLTLGGLEDEYESFVNSIRNKDGKLSFSGSVTETIQSRREAKEGYISAWDVCVVTKCKCGFEF